MESFGIALVGCGAMGAVHLNGVKAVKRARLIATVDRVEERARRYAEQFGAQVWGTDIGAILDRDDVDVVIIATYTSSHVPLAIQAMKAGRHVLVEKPLARTMEEAEAAVDVAIKTGRKLKVGFILRHHPTFLKMADLMQSGLTGRPVVMRMRLNQHIVDSAAWEEHRALIREGGPIVDCGIHYIDVMRWLTGSPVVRVSGVGGRTEQDIGAGEYNYGIVTLEFADGSVGYYESGWGHTFSYTASKEIVGPKGRIRFLSQAERHEHREEGDWIEVYRYPEQTYEVINTPAHKPTDQELEDLLDAIEQDRDVVPALEDGLETLRVTLAADEAIRTHRTIELNNP